MKLLFTGAFGFVGTNVLPLLKNRYIVSTLGLSSQNDYSVDLAKEIPCLKEAYDIVLHAAGKAHCIPKTEEEKQAFFEINFQGSKNICMALEKSGIPKAFIFISTVAVYGCEFGNDITEEHPLNGMTPYAESKKKAELYLKDWCREHNVVLSIIRPSLIVGPNPPGTLGYMIKGIRTRRYLSISNGKCKKSLLMVQDIANLVPLLIAKGGIYNVCDTYKPTFKELEIIISRLLGKPLPFSIPYWVAKCMAFIGDLFGSNVLLNTLTLHKITKSLTFNNEKARRELGWEPMNVLDHFKI